MTTTTIPNIERVATTWAWTALPRAAADQDKLVLLTYAELADRALWSDDGYSVTTVTDVAELLQMRPSHVALITERLHASHLLDPGRSGGWRIPEAAFNQ